MTVNQNRNLPALLRRMVGAIPENEGRIFIGRLQEIIDGVDSNPDVLPYWWGRATSAMIEAELHSFEQRGRLFCAEEGWRLRVLQLWLGNAAVEAKIIDFKVILERDFDNAHLRDFEYEGPSYGDAAWTLVEPAALIDELEAKSGSKYQALIDEMRGVPDGILIALEG